MTTKEALDHITSEFEKDPMYLYTWQANIAMAFYDEYERWAKDVKQGKRYFTKKDLHTVANNAALNFLNLLSQKP